MGFAVEDKSNNITEFKRDLKDPLCGLARLGKGEPAGRIALQAKSAVQSANLFFERQTLLMIYKGFDLNDTKTYFIDNEHLMTFSGKD